MWENPMTKLTSRLQVANQKRWAEEGFIKRNCAMFRNMLHCGKDSFTQEEFTKAVTAIDMIETTLLTRIRNDYERVKDGLKATSTSSKTNPTK